MFQQPRLLPWKTALDNVALGLKAAGVKHAVRHFRARELALRLGLGHRDLDKFPHQLSGGMQSRVALARCPPCWAICRVSARSVTNMACW